jgi:hypothetical protein
MSLLTVLAVFGGLNLGLNLYFISTSDAYSHLLDYQRYGWEMLKGYNLAAGLPWSLDGPTTIRLAIVGVFTIASSLYVIVFQPSGRFVLPLLLCALFQLKGAFTRSDIGHITQSTSPLAVLFAIIGALAFSRVRTVKLPAIAWSVMFVTLCVSWPWAGLYAATDIWKAVTAESPLAKYNRVRTAMTAADDVLPPGIGADASAQRPMLAFPYENHIPVKLKRPVRAPVLQAHNASTEILQRFYVDQLSTEKELDVVYGLDDVASSPLESVQSISRMPMIFEYLYRDFRLKTDRVYGQGFYLLQRDGLQREFLRTDITTREERSTTRMDLAVAIREPAMCHLLRLDLEIDYPLTRFIGRPVALDLSVFNDDTAVLTTGIAPLKANESFSTYVSLIPKDMFYQVFGRTPINTIPWNRLEFHPRPTDLVGVRPAGLKVNSIACLRVPPLDARGDIP